MREFTSGKCPFCGSWFTLPVNDNHRQCQICKVAWDRIYQYPDGKVRIHKPESPSSPEAFERLRRYVQEKLLESKAIREEDTNPVNPESVAARIVGDAWRQPNPYYFADLGIEQAVKFPPPCIDSKHFSLKAWVGDRKRKT